MSILESTEDQYDREQKRHVKSFEVGQMVKVYGISGVNRMRVKAVLSVTGKEHLKVYELESADHSISYATKDFMERV